MLVSKKFYASLIGRVRSSFDAATASQLVALIDMRVNDGDPDLAGCSEMIRMIFKFILADIEKAIARSARCREAARLRRERKESAEKPREIVIGDLDEGHELVLTIPEGMPRAERRRLEREARRRHKQLVASDRKKT